ncbi:MAG: adenylate/guanylate cyclase domain-containing protein [Candidatus Gracilibacteria bacterium]|nr:adenylate/guanylate cyclase domain-containing protein [Candidatus Gracilibacteria bacterium]
MSKIINKSKSINTINYILIVLLIYINATFYLSSNLYDNKILYLSINLIILFAYFVVNKSFYEEMDEKRKDVRMFSNTLLNSNNSDIKNILFKKIFYKENEDTYKLFKNMFIKKNLLTKDYNDLKSIFSKFVPDSFMKELGQLGNDKISLGISVKKHLNVMFLDIIGFSSISEELLPDKALLLLNIYFDGIIEIINDNGGYIDKFLGDGIMIIFDNQHADSAIKSAIEIQNFIQKFQVSEIGKKIGIGIGINSGDVILGTIGSKNRMEITIIGDVVNTASRIEGMTRIYKDNIIISEETYKTIKNINNFTIKELGNKELKGKKKIIKLYGVENILNVKL